MNGIEKDSRLIKITCDLIGTDMHAMTHMAENSFFGTKTDIYLALNGCIQKYGMKELKTETGYCLRDELTDTNFYLFPIPERDIQSTCDAFKAIRRAYQIIRKGLQ